MSRPLESARRFYRRTSVREKLFVLVFVVVALLIWISSLGDRFAVWNAERRQVGIDLQDQQTWLDRRDEWAQSLARALERVDPSKTYSSTQLAGRIDALVRQAGLLPNADIAPVRTREGEIFNDHNVAVRLSRISIAQLIQFNNLVRQDSPYINLESVRIRKNRNRPEELDVRFEINSFELKDEDPSTIAAATNS